MCQWRLRLCPFKHPVPQRAKQGQTQNRQMAWHASRESPATNPRSPRSRRCAWGGGEATQGSHAPQNQVQLRNFKSRREEVRHTLQDVGVMQRARQLGVRAKLWVWKAQGLVGRWLLEVECQLPALASVMIAQQGLVEEAAEIPTQLGGVMTRRTPPQRHRLCQPFRSILQHLPKAKHCHGLWKQQGCSDHEVVEVQDLSQQGANQMSSRQPRRI